MNDELNQIDTFDPRLHAIATLSLRHFVQIASLKACRRPPGCLTTRARNVRGALAWTLPARGLYESRGAAAEPFVLYLFKL